MRMTICGQASPSKRQMNDVVVGITCDCLLSIILILSWPKLCEPNVHDKLPWNRTKKISAMAQEGQEIKVNNSKASKSCTQEMTFQSLVPSIFVHSSYDQDVVGSSSEDNHKIVFHHES